MTQLYQRLLFVILLFTAAAAQAQVQKGLEIDGLGFMDDSGYSVSMSSDGNTLAVGATENSSGGPGYVRIFTWDGSAWIQKGLDINGVGGMIDFGCSVSLSADGKTVAIGARQSHVGEVHSGQVQIYFWGLASWIQRGDDINGEYKDSSGFSVSLSSDGNTIAIGSPRIIDAGYPGIVRIYKWNGTDWLQKGSNIFGEAIDGHSGFSVSLSSDGNTVAIGAPYHDSDEISVGQVQVYTWNDPLWIQKGLDINGEELGARCGTSVSLSSDGNTMAIGTIYSEGEEEGVISGHVSIYSWIGMAWVQKGSDLGSEGHYDQNGYSVSMSSDGNTVAIGAPHTIGGGDSNEGKCLLFYWDGSVWIQRGTTIIGEAVGDHFGLSVSLSSDGNTVAIGAPQNDALGEAGAGHARVYEFCTEDINVDVNLIATDTLQADNGADGLSYQWIDCKDSSEIAGATAQTYGAEINGEFAVIINQNGCIDTSACTAITEIGVGISENHSNQIKIYPNPSSGIMYFESAGAEIESIKLYNSLGQLVESWAVSGTKTELNLSEFERGIYSVIIETAIGQTRKQIVVR